VLDHWWKLVRDGSGGSTLRRLRPWTPTAAHGGRSRPSGPCLPPACVEAAQVAYGRHAGWSAARRGCSPTFLTMMPLCWSILWRSSDGRYSFLPIVGTNWSAASKVGCYSVVIAEAAIRSSA